MPLHLTGLAVVVALLAALSLVPAIGFGSVLAGWSFLWAPIVAVVAAGAVTVFAQWRRLLVGESIALSLVMFLLVGVVAIGGSPTPAAVSTFLHGLVDGWAELLTSFAPADVTPTFLVLPYTLAWLGMLTGGEILRGTTTPGLPALGPLVMLGVSVLFSIENRAIAITQGVAAVLLTLVLGLVQQAQQRTTRSDLTTGSSHRWRGRGLVAAVALLVLVVALAPVLGPRLPGADANPRFELRERLEPPFNPLNLPSPLAQVKGELEGDRAEEVVLRVTTDEPVRRWPVAVMGSYDGRVWTVAESADSGAGQYRPVDTQFPAVDDGEVDLSVDPVEATVQAVDLRDNWLPTPGWPRRLTSPDELDVRYNEVTGNVVLPQRVPDGATWTVTAVPRVEVDDEAMAGVDVALEEAGSDLAAVPPVLRTLAGDLVEGLDPGWEQVAAIRDLLLEDGYYDLSPETPPGHSFFHLSRFLEDPERIVGFEEQYAASAAVLGRLAGVGVRVVVGYDVPAERFDDRPTEIRAGDLSAWVEVRADGFGWVPVDVTPTDESAPEASEATQTVEDVAIPNPPPPPPPPPQVERPEQPPVEEESEEPEEDDEDEAATGPNLPILVAGVGIGMPLLALGLFMAVVLALKARRRRRREHAPDAATRLSGAWEELRDRFDERGLRATPTASPREVAFAVADRFPSARGVMVDLADRVDRGAFHPLPPDDETAAGAWTLSDEASRELDRDRSTWERWRARLSVAPLRRKDT
ncbi:transglutaminaseTgpA domain-containing protein [Salsipaludibacter albus]|uniref:transglutaminaseTgpA domain-containing protein n=1 Tax=Salsipaludibacter albus TaxID=2849650 RepID=UPI001EE3A5AF|nr:transglutaminaseTgpA domain-containing protein [Salsipaludibacter albus]MBY5161291.1 DUF3488 and transglutaminase-like domain-containing protein [Salsipaludibacter albus]